MNKISNSYMMHVITKLLVLLVIAKSISLVLWWYLPSDSIELQTEANYKPKYQKIDFENMLESTLAEKEKSTVKQESASSGTSISNMILKGLYGDGSKGFAIVALKSSPANTLIVSVGEEFSGYILKTILSDSVVFTKAGKESVLFMDNIKESTIPKPLHAVANAEDKKAIAKTDIEFYAKNPNQIWKDISIDEIKDANEIKGFKVSKISKQSKISQLGLQEGDIIVEVNNVKLKSYKDALDVYKDINNLSSVQITVLRNNAELELVYEIN